MPSGTTHGPAPKVEASGDDDLDDETLAAIAELEDDPGSDALRSCTVLKLCSFVVPEAVLPIDASLAARQRFLELRLGRHLPCAVAKVRRLDLQLFEPGAVIVRVWCQLD